MEVRAHPAPEGGCLADVDDLALGVLEEVDAGPIGQALEFFGRHVECRVFHTEWIEDAFAHEGAERLSRHSCDQDSEHIGTHVIHPALARLGQPRQRAELLQPYLRAGCLRRQRRTVAADPIFADQFLDRVGVRHRHHAAEAHAERQQIANGDRAPRRHRVVERR